LHYRRRPYRELDYDRLAKAIVKTRKAEKQIKVEQEEEEVQKILRKILAGFFIFIAALLLLFAIAPQLMGLKISRLHPIA